MIDELLSPRRIEPLAPEPGGSDAAWDEIGRRRRRRALRTQIAAGVGLVLVVMVGVLPSLDDGGRAAELDVAGRETKQRTNADTPSLLEDTSEDAAEAEAGSASGFAPSPGRAPSPSSDSPTVVESRPGATAPAPGRPKPAIQRTRYETVYIGCLDWCLSPGAVQQGDSYALSLDLCVAVGARARRFSYATTQEVDLWVATAGQSPETVWTWSLGQQFPAHEHHVDIAAGECVKWEAQWDGTNEAGEPLPPGTYRLYAKSFAEQVAQGSTTQTTFQIPE